MTKTDKILHRAFDKLVDTGLDPIVAATSMARAGLAALHGAACCEHCLVASLIALHDEVEEELGAIIEDAVANAAMLEDGDVAPAVVH